MAQFLNAALRILWEQLSILTRSCAAVMMQRTPNPSPSRYTRHFKFRFGFG